MGFCIGLCIDLGGGAAEGVEETGRPLEDLPDWTLILDEEGGESHFGWENYGRSIIAYENTAAPEVQSLAFKDLSGESAVISANVTYVPPSSETDNFALILSKFVDAGDIVGCRANNGEYQIVERIGGTWTTIASGGVPSAGLWEFKVFDTSVSLWVDGVEVLSATTAVLGSGYWGITGHQWNNDGVTLMADFEVTMVQEAETPCMTSNTSPYGVASACCNISGYPAWEGLNCKAPDGGDAWCVPVDTPMPVWLQWKFDEALPMIPTRVHIKPRVAMEQAWYDQHNPKEIKIYLIQAGDVLVEVGHFDNLNWNDATGRDFYISTTEMGIGLRLEIVRTNASDGNGGLGHTCIGYFKGYGAVAPLDYVTYEGDTVTYNTDPVFYTE